MPRRKPLKNKRLMNPLTFHRAKTIQNKKRVQSKMACRKRVSDE